MKIFDFFKSWFSKRAKTAFTFKTVTVVTSFFDVPEQTGDVIYVVKSGRVYKWVLFQCPNGCGQRIEVNLMKVRYPQWRLTFSGGKISLSPSVVVDECGAHFWLTNNEVVWAFFEEETHPTR